MSKPEKTDVLERLRAHRNTLIELLSDVGKVKARLNDELAVVADILEALEREWRGPKQGD